MLSIQQKQIAYNYSTRTQTIKYIVIHDTGNPGASALNHYTYFNGGDRQSSACYFVDSSNIIETVNPTKYYSWHCGDGGGTYGITNANSIGIEMCLESDGNLNTATVQNTIDLVEYLMNKWNISIDNVVRHYDASRKTCPNSLSANNWAKWTTFKEDLKCQIEGCNTVEYKNEYVVCYCNDIDKRCAEYLADYLGCECKDATVPSDWSLYAENHICVGGNSSGSIGFSSHRTHWIQGSNRYKTAQEVLNVIFGTTKLDRWKV